MYLISKRTKELRIKNNLTQKQLSEILKIQPNSVQRIEYGTARPSIDTLVTLANYFDVSLDYLLGRTDNPEINK